MASGSHTQKTPATEFTAIVPPNALSPRPFPPSQPATAAPPDLQAQLEHAQRFGHKMEKIQFGTHRPTPTILQPKLTIGAPGDKYEQEADRVAQQVVQRLNAPKLERPQSSKTVQRETMPEDDEELQMKPDTLQREAIPENKDKLQMKPLRAEKVAGGTTSANLESAINSAKGGGLPLNHRLQQQMGQAMGADFRGVRVHTNATADQLSRSIQAKAFTTGQDIFFRQGAYQPENASGQELLAHELTHVVQQNGSTAGRRSIEPINRKLEFEQKPSVKRANVSSIEQTKTIQRDNGQNQQNEEIEAQKASVSTFKSLYDGTLTGLAAALKAAPVKEGLLSDEFLLRILREAFEENWFKAKACLTTDHWPGVEEPPKHEVSIELMKAMVNMRGRMWDKFVKKVQPLIIGEVMRVRNISDQFTDISNPKNMSNLGENFGLKAAVGSQTVTSDLDLSGMGANTEIGVALINREFPTYFGVSVEPGALFDINVYSSDWMFGGEEVKGEQGIFTVKPRSESEVLTNQALSKENQKKKDDQSEVWSMVKIRRNMTAVDWNIYKASVLGGISDVAQINEMKRKFDLVDAEYRTFHDTVQTEVAKMEKALNHEEKHQKSAFADKRGKDHLGEEAMEMAASNRQYEAIILRVKALRLQIKKLHDENAPRAKIERLLLDLHNEISRGLTYANEVYATEGAVLHTVYGKQGADKKLKALKDPTSLDGSKFMAKDEITKVKYLLSKEQYLQSVNENVGDTLHSINHNEHDPQYAVYRAGKYIDRLCEAVRELIGEDAAKEIQAYPKLLEIGDASTREKSGAAGNDPTAVHLPSSFFSKYKKADLGKVKVWAMDLGSKTTVTYKKTLS